MYEKYDELNVVIQLLHQLHTDRYQCMDVSDSHTTSVQRVHNGIKNVSVEIGSNCVTLWENGNPEYIRQSYHVTMNDVLTLRKLNAFGPVYGAYYMAFSSGSYPYGDSTAVKFDVSTTTTLFMTKNNMDSASGSLMPPDDTGDLLVIARPVQQDVDLPGVVGVIYWKLDPCVVGQNGVALYLALLDDFKVKALREDETTYVFDALTKLILMEDTAYQSVDMQYAKTLLNSEADAFDCLNFVTDVEREAIIMPLR